MQALKILILSVLMATGLAIAPATAKAGEPAFSQAELDQMLAPIALYPDTVLSHVLIASTYPLEVIQAARWTRANPDLSGEQAVAAVEHMDWDPSVMALVAFPELLARMDEDIEWTQRLGDAFLVQEEQVVDTVQRLRDRAYAQGHLKTNEHVRVIRETEYIYIEPRQTRVVYVPYYNPRVVYGPWWWSAYPPVYWHYPHYTSGVTFYWGRAYRVSPRFYFSSFYWPSRQVVVINHHHYYHSSRHFTSGRQVAHYKDSRHWQHNPHHRRGVAYHRNVSERRFVEQPSGQTVRATSDRQAVQARSNRRDWAAERRENLDISQRSAARPSTRNEQRASAERQSRVSDASASPANRQGARQGDRPDRSATQSRLTERSRPEPSQERAAAPSRQASEVRDNLANRDQNRSRSSSRDTTGRTSQSDSVSRTEPAGSRPAIQRQQRDDSRPSVTIPRAQASDNERSTRQQSGATQRQSRSAPPASRPDAGSVSSRIQQTTRPAASSPQRQSQPQASPPRTSTRQSAPVSSPRSTAPAPRQSPQQSTTPSRSSSSAPARSAPRSAPSRPSNSNTRSSGNQGSSNRSSPQNRIRSRGGNREQ